MQDSAAALSPPVSSARPRQWPRSVECPPTYSTASFESPGTSPRDLGVALDEHIPRPLRERIGHRVARSVPEGLVSRTLSTIPSKLVDLPAGARR